MSRRVSCDGSYIVFVMNCCCCVKIMSAVQQRLSQTYLLTRLTLLVLKIS